jgi:hypothetical protein
MYPKSPYRNQRLLASYALTLFILGVMVGLLAVLGRIAEEFQHRLIIEITLMPRSASGADRVPLPPLIDSARNSGARFVIFGFLVSLVSMTCGGAVWFLGGRPDAPHARTWTALGGGIAFCLLLSMGNTAFVAHEDVRLVMLIVPSAVALLLFIALVYLVAERTLFAP